MSETENLEFTTFLQLASVAGIPGTAFACGSSIAKRGAFGKGCLQLFFKNDKIEV